MNTDATIQRDVEAIKQLGHEFFNAVNAGDLHRRMSTMDPTVVIMPPDRPPIVGKEEVRRLSQDYSAHYDEQCSVTYDEVEPRGNWGFVRATVTATRTRKPGGTVERLNMTNLWIVKKQADGEWRFLRIMFNHTTAPRGLRE